MTDAIDFEGASYTWKDNPPLQARMKTAAENARVPVLFLQAENDADTTPSRALSELMTAAGKKGQMHIYPPNGTTAEQGHDFCEPDAPSPKMGRRGARVPARRGDVTAGNSVLGATPS